MKHAYFFKNPVGPDDWSALPRKFLAGEIVEKFTGHTYGLDRDDLMYLNTETIPCTCEGHQGFFTVPVSMLEDMEGNSPLGAYVRYGSPVSAPQESSND